MHKGLNLRGIISPEDETRSIDAHNYAAMEDCDAAKERGEHPADELPEKKQEFNTKHRGLSADLVCVITGVERP